MTNMTKKLFPKRWKRRCQVENCPCPHHPKPIQYASELERQRDTSLVVDQLLKEGHSQAAIAGSWELTVSQVEDYRQVFADWRAESEAEREARTARANDR